MSPAPRKLKIPRCPQSLSRTTHAPRFRNTLRVAKFIRTTPSSGSPRALNGERLGKQSVDASSSAHPNSAFLPGRLLLLSAGNGLSGKVGCDPEEDSCCDVLACFWIGIPAGRDPAASPDHHPLPGETRAACRRQCFFAALHFLDFCAQP